MEKDSKLRILGDLIQIAQDHISFPNTGYGGEGFILRTADVNRKITKYLDDQKISAAEILPEVLAMTEYHHSLKDKVFSEALNCIKTTLEDLLGKTDKTNQNDKRYTM